MYAFKSVLSSFCKLVFGTIVKLYNTQYYTIPNFHANYLYFVVDIGT